MRSMSNSMRNQRSQRSQRSQRNQGSQITIHRPEELSGTLRAAWHRVMDESPDFGNPFLAPEFAAGVGRHRGGARVAVLHEGAEAVGFFPYERGRSGSGGRSVSGSPTARPSSTAPESPGTPGSC